MTAPTRITYTALTDGILLDETVLANPFQDGVTWTRLKKQERTRELFSAAASKSLRVQRKQELAREEKASGIVPELMNEQRTIDEIILLKEEGERVQKLKAERRRRPDSGAVTRDAAMSRMTAGGAVHSGFSLPFLGSTSSLLLIWTALFCQASGEKTSCVVASVPAGSPTALTCYFNENLRDTGKDFSVERLRDTGSGIQTETVLDCYWVDNNPTCVESPGYHFNGSFSDTLTLEIPNATQSQVGNYECHVVPSTPGDQASCGLFLQELWTSTVPFASMETGTSEPSKEFEDAASGELTAGAIAGIVLAVFIVLLAGLISVWKFWDCIRKVLRISGDAWPTEEEAAQMQNLKSEC